MAFCDLHYGENKTEHEIIAEPALVGRDETKYDGFRDAIGAVPDNDAFLNDRLVYLAFYISHHITKRR
ncbi:Uncharacterised protein [uncultured archaeon]|nr:Uncharacterised protein [uncultured archaeon]